MHPTCKIGKAKQPLVVRFDEVPLGLPDNTTLNKMMNAILDCFQGKQRQVLEWRMGYGGKKCLQYEEICTILDCAMEEAFTIEADCYRFLKTACEFYHRHPELRQKKLLTGGRKRVARRQAIQDELQYIKEREAFLTKKMERELFLAERADQKNAMDKG